MVTVVITNTDHMPGWPRGIGKISTPSCQSVSDHLPDSDQSAAVLKQNVAIVTSIEMAAAQCVPAGPGVVVLAIWHLDDPFIGRGGPVHFPDRDHSAIVLPQYIRLPRHIEITGPNNMPAL